MLLSSRALRHVMLVLDIMCLRNSCRSNMLVLIATCLSSLTSKQKLNIIIIVLSEIVTILNETKVNKLNLITQ